jgi:ferredoxin-NADP reductase
MLRHRVAAGCRVPVRLLLSARTIDEVIYRAELDSLSATDPVVEIVYTLTRSQPPGWTGFGRRIDAALLAGVAWPPEERPLCYVCGPTGLVEAAASLLLDLGYQPDRIKTERFGPSGG